MSAAGRREFKVDRALLSEAGGWRTRSGGGVTESRSCGSALELTPAVPLFAGRFFSNGNSLFASRVLAAASRLAAACASETATEYVGWSTLPRAGPPPPGPLMGIFLRARTKAHMNLERRAALTVSLDQLDLCLISTFSSILSIDAIPVISTLISGWKSLEFSLSITNACISSRRSWTSSRVVPKST